MSYISFLEFGIRQGGPGDERSALFICAAVPDENEHRSLKKTMMACHDMCGETHSRVKKSHRIAARYSFGVKPCPGKVLSVSIHVSFAYA